MQEITVETFPTFSFSKKLLITDIWIRSIVPFLLLGVQIS